MAIATESLEEFEKMVHPEKLSEYRNVRDLYLSTTAKTQRIPGLFKVRSYL